MAWNKPSGSEAVPSPLQDGKSTSDLKRKGFRFPTGFRFPIRGAVAGAIVVVGAGIAAWWLWPTHDDAAVSSKPPYRDGLIREVKPAAAPKPEVAPEPEKPKRPANWKQMSKEERAQWHKENPTTRERKRYLTFELPSRRKNLKLPFENNIQLELSQYTVPGANVPAPEHFTDEMAREACEKEIKFNFDDPLDLLERKRAVQDMLVELKEYLDAGKHADDFFADLQARQSLESEAVDTARRTVHGLMREGDVEGARAALEKFNKYLEDRSIPPIRVRGLR